jgi:RNA polymerase sigma-70 factor, ECF subfamily
VGPPPTSRRAIVVSLSSRAPRGYETEEELARGLIRQERAAAVAAWDTYAALVRSLLARTLGPNVEVDDSVQEVFLTLWRRAPTLRDVTALRSFVVSITVRVARAELRRRRYLRWLSFRVDEDLPDSATDPPDLEAREAVRRLYRVLDKLAPNERLAFTLRYADELELTEVADALGCSLATAKRRLAHAVERVLLHAKKDAVLAALVERVGEEP